MDELTGRKIVLRSSNVAKTMAVFVRAAARPVFMQVSCILRPCIVYTMYEHVYERRNVSDYTMITQSLLCLILLEMYTKFSDIYFILDVQVGLGYINDVY